MVLFPAPAIMVALRKESVDRNLLALLICPPRGTSLSARRAWIEMIFPLFLLSLLLVALRKESVDRNVNLRVVDGSKSSVALRKESVDRNLGGVELG